MIGYVIPEEQTARVLSVTADFVKNTFYGVDCDVPCENWPTRAEQESLLASDIDAVRDLKEISLYLGVVASKDKCPGKPILYVEYGGVSALRPIGDLIRQMEEESGMDIPCVLVNR